MKTLNMNKRYFKGTIKCGFCGKELTEEDICEYWPSFSDSPIDEEQCPYCGYHNTLIETPYNE